MGRREGGTEGVGAGYHSERAREKQSRGGQRQSSFTRQLYRNQSKFTCRQSATRPPLDFINDAGQSRSGGKEVGVGCWKSCESIAAPAACCCQLGTGLVLLVSGRRERCQPAQQECKWGCSYSKAGGAGFTSRHSFSGGSTRSSYRNSSVERNTECSIFDDGAGGERGEGEHVHGNVTV